MYPLSDKDLDRLSKQASEQTDVDQNTSGWEKLEQKLNKELPLKKEKDRRRFLWIFFLVIALGSSGLVFMLNRQQNDIAHQTVASNNTPSSQSPSAIVSKDDNTEKKNPATSTTQENSSQNIQETVTSNPTEKEETAPDTNNTNHQKSASVDQKSSLAVSVNKDQPNSSVNKSETSARIIAKNKKLNTQKESNPGFKSKSTLLLTQGNQANEEVFSRVQRKRVTVKKTATKPTTESISGQIDKAAKSNTDEETVVTSKENGNESTNSRSSTNLNLSEEKKEAEEKLADSASAVAPLKEDISKQKQPKSTPSNKNPLAFGFFAGTDFSKINGTSKSKPGYSLGLQVSYNLTSRLSINTGFSITKKFYKATGSDFHPPKHYFTNYVDKLISVDGNCFMWELPVNLRYDLVTKSNFKWFINAGMSSYIMRKQEYDYDYINNNILYSKNWKNGSQQNEWFKIAHFSTGLEYAVSKKWSFQAEPYIKLPLTGVGFGQMDISSYGIQLGIRYRPKFRK